MQFDTCTFAGYGIVIGFFDFASEVRRQIPLAVGFREGDGNLMSKGISPFCSEVNTQI